MACVLGQHHTGTLKIIGVLYNTSSMGTSLYPLQHPLSHRPSVTARLRRLLLLLLSLHRLPACLCLCLCFVSLCACRGAGCQPGLNVCSSPLPSNAVMCGVCMFWGGGVVCVIAGGQRSVCTRLAHANRCLIVQQLPTPTPSALVLLPSYCWFL